MGSMSHIRDALDDTKYWVYDIMDRMRYHTTGEEPPNKEITDFCCYSIDLDFNLARMLAEEIDYKIREGMSLSESMIKAEDAGLITPVEFKLILPKPPVPVHREFITEITPEDLRRWKLDGTT